MEIAKAVVSLPMRDGNILARTSSGEMVMLLAYL